MASRDCRPRCDYCGAQPCVGEDCPSNWDFSDGGTWEPCWHCHGAGDFDEYDYDPVNFDEGEEVEPCPECNGRGGYYV